MKNNCVKIVDRTIIIPMSMYNDEYNYKVHFDIDCFEKSNDKYLCPFCNKKYKNKKGLSSHMNMYHLFNYDLSQHLLECKNIKSKSFCTGLSTELISFKHNILFVLEKMEYITKNVINDFKNIFDSISIDDENCLKEIYCLNHSIILLRYIRTYFTAILMSDDFVKELFNYIYKNDKQTFERKKLGQVKGLCQICNVKAAKEKHHIIPLVYGGSNEKHNIIDVCKDCHQQDAFELVFHQFKKKQELKSSNLVKS